MQGNTSFFASFSALYLADSNNLLTHTHTQERDILMFVPTRA